MRIATLAKQARETMVFCRFFAIAAGGRIGEKGAAFPVKNGPQHDVRCSEGSDSRHHRGYHGISPGFLHRPYAAGATLLRPWRGRLLAEFCDPDSARRDSCDRDAVFRQAVTRRAWHV